MPNSSLSGLVALGAAALLLAAGREAKAQDQQVRPLVRVHAPSVASGTVEGRVQRAGDTLVVETDGGPLRVPLAAVERLELRAGASRGRGALRGLAIGVLVGAAGGAFLPLDDCGADGRDDEKVCTRSESVGFSALGFGAIGAAVGALVPVPVWRRISPSAIAVVPAWRDGQLVGARVAMRVVVRPAR